MAWYYAEAGLRHGPVSDGEFDQLAAAGQVRARTLLWREGMGDWARFDAVVQQFPPAAAQSPGNPPGARSFCGQCQRYQPIDEMLAYDGRWICADCKGPFFQRLTYGEGDTPPPLADQTVMAGFWIRLVATLLDALVLSIVFSIIVPTLGSGLNLSRQDLLNLLFVAIPVLYETIMVGTWGGSLGKLFVGVRVRGQAGQRIGYARSLGRAGAKFLSLAICFVGFVIAGFDPQKRALHDWLAGTYVVYR